MLGRRIPASEAHSWGLITRIADDTAALNRILDEITTTLANMSPLALKTIKRVLNTSYDSKAPRTIAGFGDSALAERTSAGLVPR
jgi:2-oxoglutaroyl-CoA hydrolase